MMRVAVVGLVFTAGLPLLSAAESADWGTVAVIFDRHCVECHNAVKRKGGVRLDAHAMLPRAGGSNIPLLLPGEPQSSALFQRVVLEAADADVMPPVKAGGPLPAEDIARIRAWILAGAPGPTASAAAVVSATASATARPAAQLLDPDQDALDRLSAVGAQTWRVGDGLGLSLRHVVGNLDDRIWQPMRSIAARIRVVDVTNQSLEPGDCGHLVTCAGLQRLDLSRASLTAESLSRFHASRDLRVLVLSGTKIRGDGEQAIAGFTQVTRIHLPGSASAAALARPGLEIIR